MSPKDQPRSRPVPTQRSTMSCHAGGDRRTAQPTCCRQPSATTTESYSLALEITHAFRLRRKLAAAEPGRALVINVWGVGYRLCDSEVRR
jgi:hypothetical protein